RPENSSVNSTLFSSVSSRDFGSPRWPWRRSTNTEELRWPDPEVVSSQKQVKGEVTEEERLLQLQQRAQAEEEMAKKKEETLTLYLKKEQRNASVNLLKLIESWRKNLRQARDAEQLKHVAILQQTNERKLDEQNFIMQKTKRELEEADRHADQVQRCHLQQEEDLLGQRDRVLMNLEQQWDSSLQNLSFILSSEMSVKHHKRFLPKCSTLKPVRGLKRFHSTLDAGPNHDTTTTVFYS
ncbi:hypothetical protein GOODEAATRI_030523, partial [Goodea atripinnis]